MTLLLACCQLVITCTEAYVAGNTGRVALFWPLTLLRSGCAACLHCRESEYATPADTEGEPEFGTTTWVISTALQLVASRVFQHPESKKLMLQSLILLLTGNGAKWTDPLLFTQLLHLLDGWLFAHQHSALSIKEAVLLLQRLAHVDQDRIMSDLVMRHKWQIKFLDLLYRLCTSDQIAPVSPGIDTMMLLLIVHARHPGLVPAVAVSTVSPCNCATLHAWLSLRAM